MLAVAGRTELYALAARGPRYWPMKVDESHFDRHIITVVAVNVDFKFLEDFIAKEVAFIEAEFPMS